MKWTTGLSRSSDLTQAFGEACAMLDGVSPDEIDVVLAFFSAHHAERGDQLAEAMAEQFPGAVCIGCNAAGVVGAGTETGDEISVSLTAGVLPGVEVRPIRFESDVHDRPDFDWSEEIGHQFEQTPHFLILSEPHSFETQALLAALDRGFPESEKFGGLVSGATEETGNKLLLDGEIFSGGAVGLAFSGDLRIDTIVAQSCRPVGDPMIVTDHTHNVVHRFDKGNPMKVFRKLVYGLEGEERELAQHAMFVGIGVESKLGEYHPGDFVIRNIVGFNPKSGDLAVAAPIEDLEVLQFHLMDPRTSANEFERAMQDFASEFGDDNQTRGALLFSCVSRGESKYGGANHESELVRRYFGQMPIGGFFSDGEIAQVGQKTCLHGYASAVTLFREPLPGGDAN
jgi:small ligand-binding sensory domain FIST